MFMPRPDSSPEWHDQQTSFYNSNDKVSVLFGGNGSGVTKLAIETVSKYLRETSPKKPFYIASFIRDDAERFAWNVVSNIGIGLGLDIRAGSVKHAVRDTNGIDLSGFIMHDTTIDRVFFDLLRRLRETNGRAFMAACPLLCGKKYFLREMERGSRLILAGKRGPKITPMPEGWKIYHSSTRKALEAGQISKKWYDEFTSTIPDDELPTRLWGAWPK